MPASGNISNFGKIISNGHLNASSRLHNKISEHGVCPILLPYRPYGTIISLFDAESQIFVTITTRATLFVLTLLTDQRKLLLWLQIRRSDNAVLQTMSMLNRSQFTALYSKYSKLSPGKVKKT